MNVALTARSSNSKTGTIPVTVSSRDTCPDSCSLKGNGCYAECGYYTRLHWDKVTKGERGLAYSDFIKGIRKLKAKTLWRHNVSGDLQGYNNVIDRDALKLLVKANSGKRGFTYTHYPIVGKKYSDNREAIKQANNNGFTVNLSADSLSQADELSNYHIAPVVVVLPSTTVTNTVTPDGRKVVVCPASVDDTATITCKTCKLCSVRDNRPIIGFPAHGSGSSRVDKTIGGL